MKKYLILISLLLAACGKEQQETPANLAARTTMPEGISWQAPAGWVKEVPTSAMRKAQYALPQADGDTENASVVVFFFQGQGGSVEANIQRWYSQIMQPDGSQTQDKATRHQQTVNGLTQTVVDVTGTYLFRARPMAGEATQKPGFRMIAAVVESDSGPWFVKLVGPKKTVAKWEDSFGDFLKSFSG